MNTYDREFLLPYLENICALQLQNRKIRKELAGLTQEREKYQGYLKTGGVNRPSFPNLEPVASGGRVFIMVIGILSVLIAFIVSPSMGRSDAWVGWFLGLIGLAFVIGSGRSMYNASVRNTELESTYESNRRRYDHQHLKNRELASQKLPEIQEKLEHLTGERNKIHELLEKAYSVNVIPMQFRALYPAVYLFQWFSTSSSADLDHALSMYALNEIKDRLDTFIENQAEMMINQKIMIANQMKNMQMQQEAQAQLMARLDQIEATEEERNRYLSMIESNTATTAYFTTMDHYLKD